MANINLIDDKDRYSDGEINRAFMREITNGFEMEKAMSEDRHSNAAMEAAEFRKANRTVKGLGKIVACIDHRDFFRAREKYGHDEVHSKEFIRSIQKYHPELTVNRV